jgi:hypothetical protein
MSKNISEDTFHMKCPFIRTTLRKQFKVQPPKRVTYLKNMTRNTPGKCEHARTLALATQADMPLIGPFIQHSNVLTPQ